MTDKIVETNNLNSAPSFYKREYRLSVYKMLVALIFFFGVLILTTWIALLVFYPKIWGYIKIKELEVFKVSFFQINNWWIFLFIGPFVLFVTVKFFLIMINFSSFRNEYKLYKKNFPTEATNQVKRLYLKYSCSQLNWNWFSALIYVWAVLGIGVFLVFIYAYNSWLIGGKKAGYLFYDLAIYPDMTATELGPKSFVLRNVIIFIAAGAGAWAVIHAFFVIWIRLRLNRMETYYALDKLVDAELLMKKLSRINKRNMIIFILSVTITIGLIFYLVVRVLLKRQIPFLSKK